MRFKYLLITLLLTATTATAQTPQSLKTAELRIGEHTLTTELALTANERSIGLMYRESMDEYQAMLFVYDDRAQRCFWMLNTLIPLTLAFLDDQGTVLQLADMAPQTTTSHCSNQPVRFALEVNQGWFKRHGVGVGDRVEGLSGL